jgi:hypothetical protein
METPLSNDDGLPEDDLKSLLVRVHALRRQEQFDDARLLLETALTQWSESQEVKDLLLQTEKDQLATRRMKKPDDSEMDVGIVEKPWQAIAIGLFCLVAMGAILFDIGRTVIHMVRFGVAAPWAVSTRGTYQVYYVPTYTTLWIPLCFFCFLLWVFVQAVKSFRS